MGRAFVEIWRHAVIAYRDVYRIAPTMWRSISVMAAALLATAVASVALHLVVRTPVGRVFVDAISAAGLFWLTAPHVVALYRAIVGATPESVAALRSQAASQHVFAWATILGFVSHLPQLVAAILGSRRPYPIYYGPEGLPPAAFNAGPVVLIALIAVSIVVVRLATLLPGLALHDQPLSLADAFEETRGRFWFTLGAVTLPLLPSMLIAVVLDAMINRLAGVPIVQLMLAVPMLGVSVATILVGMAISARLHQRYTLPQPAE